MVCKAKSLSKSFCPHQTQIKVTVYSMTLECYLKISESDEISRVFPEKKDCVSIKVTGVMAAVF